MNRPSSLFTFRWSLFLLLVIGLFLLFLFFLPFETIASGLNRLASDGNFESFTVERYQVLSKLAGLLGLVFTVFPGLALVRWADTQKVLDAVGRTIREFNINLRQDARNFWGSISLSKWSRTEWRVLVGLMLVALSVRLANLYLPLAHDEAYTYNAFASRSLWVTISDYHLPNNHVFLTIIINILTHIFGNHLWLIRLPTIIAGTLMIPAAFVLGRRWYSREAGWLGAALVAVFPILVEYSVLARGYAFINLFTLMALILGDQVRESKNRFIWLLLIVTNAFGFYTIPTMMFPFGGLYIWLFLSCMIGNIDGYRSKLEYLKYWLSSGFGSAFLTVLLYAPILITDFDNFFGNSFVQPLNKDLFPAVFWSRMEMAWADWMHTIPTGLVMVGVTGFLLSILFHFKISRPKVPVQLTYFIWIAAYLIARRPDIMTRMWSYLAAPLLIWSAGGIIESLRWVSEAFRKRIPLAQVFLGISLVSIFVYGLFSLISIPQRWSQKSSVEKAVIYLKDTLQNGDLVTATVEYFPQVRYYFGVYNVSQDYLRKSGNFRRAFVVVGERKRKTLEDAVPKMGPNSDRPAVNMDNLRIVLDLGDLTIYEGDPAP
jgi:hypothetical protein